MKKMRRQATNSTYALILLSTIFALGYADRGVINLLLDSIKAEFLLSDTVLGLITGFGFALFQVSLGIPIARWADRSHRVNILTAGLLLWSTMTVLCGRAGSAWQLAVTRMGVGVGEACLVAPSHSLLSDFVSKERRSRAFAVLASGGDVGNILGLLIGGWVGHYWGWRTAFVVAGLPGIVVGILFWLTVQEPDREASKTQGDRVTESLASTLRFLMGQKSYVYALLGGCAIGMTLFPLHVWGPSFLRRLHHLDSAAIGTYVSIARVVGIVGVISGGFLTDYLCRKGNEAWRLRSPAIACALTAPALLLFLFSDSVWMALIGLGLTTATVGAHLGPLFAVCQMVVKSNMRALASSIFIFCSAMVGSGLGSLIIGMLSDALTPTYGDAALRYALLLPVGTALIASALMWQGGHRIKSDLGKLS